jgi:hypothetical protein
MLACLIIDALDECLTDLPELLNLIVQMSSVSSHVKWIVSSRNWPEIQGLLETAGQKVTMCLELNEASVSTAVGSYIEHKVLRLTQLKKYDKKTDVAVRDHLSSNANGTFLWVALVCQNLETVPRWNTLSKLSAFPPSLDSLYGQMIQQIYKSDYIDLCKRILAVATIVRRPISLHELTSLVDILEGVSDDTESLMEIVALCGSFLTVRERTVYFIHQSAKDFLLSKASDTIFPSGMEDLNYEIFSRSLGAMSANLGRDMYGLRAPGSAIDQVRVPEPDPLATVRYSCIYWIDHLCDSVSGMSIRQNSESGNGGAVHTFLEKTYLYWLEALSLLRGMSEGVIAMGKLEDLLVSYRPIILC